MTAQYRITVPAAVPPQQFEGEGTYRYPEGEGPRALHVRLLPLHGRMLNEWFARGARMTLRKPTGEVVDVYSLDLVSSLNGWAEVRVNA